MEQQEYFLKVQMLGQEAEKVEQQIQMIDQQISELNAVRESLESLKKDKNKEILANLGKGIFIKAVIKEEDLFVNVGKEIILKKSFDETLQVIEAQNAKMISGKQELIERIQQLQEEMQEIMNEMQDKKLLGHEHSHECDNEECECEEPCEDCKCERK